MKLIASSILSLGLSLSLLGDVAQPVQINYAFDPATEAKPAGDSEEQVTTSSKAAEKARVNGEESTISQVCKNCRLA